MPREAKIASTRITSITIHEVRIVEVMLMSKPICSAEVDFGRWSELPDDGGRRVLDVLEDDRLGVGKAR